MLQRETFVEQTESWWESVRTEAEEICRTGEVERGWNLLQEGVAKLPTDASRAKTCRRRNTSQTERGI